MCKAQHMTPNNIPMPTLAILLIQSLSIANFTKKVMTMTKLAVPILLTKFSPTNFSKSRLFFLNLSYQVSCVKYFIYGGGTTFCLGISALVTSVLTFGMPGSICFFSGTTKGGVDFCMGEGKLYRIFCLLTDNIFFQNYFLKNLSNLQAFLIWFLIILVFYFD
jgi:hypothetical protein